MKIKIPNIEIDKIRIHGEEVFPEECCGVLIANGEDNNRVIETRRMRNINSGSKNTRYNIDPLELIKLEDELDKKDQIILGIYHSHPNHPSKPSKFDFSHAWPNLSYVIASINNGLFEKITSWRLDESRTSFEEERIVTNFKEDKK